MSLAFSPDSRLLATGHEDGALRLWDADNGKLLQTLPGHSRSILCVAFPPGGGKAATAGADGTIKIWPLPAR